MQANRGMVAVAIGIACIVSASCHQTRPTQPSNQPCVATCTRTPTIEPLGQLCTLQSDSCHNGVRTCIYHCEAVESREPIELEIRTRPRRPLLVD